MSKIQFNSEMFRQELELNKDAILVVTVEDLFRAWKKKQGPVSKHTSCIPAHSHVSKIQNSTVTNISRIPYVNQCHTSSKLATMHTDSVPSITQRNVGDTIEFVDEYLVNWVVPTKDVLMHVVPIAKDLGFMGKVILKKVDNKDYVIIKGYPGRRTFLTGTKYLSTHPKIMQLAIGKVALKKTMRAGGKLTVYMTISLELLRLVLGTTELYECGVNIASDLAKIGVATVIGEAVGMAAAGSATIGAIAAGPIILAIVVGVGVGFALDYFDSQYNITNRVAAMMEKMGEKIIAEIRNDYNQASENVYQGLRHWIYNESSGFDIENPI